MNAIAEKFDFIRQTLHITQKVLESELLGSAEALSKDQSEPATAFAPNLSHRFSPFIKPTGCNLLGLTDIVSIWADQIDVGLRLLINYMDGRHGLEEDFMFRGLQAAQFSIQDMVAIFQEFIARQCADPGILKSVALLQGMASRLVGRFERAIALYPDGEPSGSEREALTREIESIRGIVISIGAAMCDLKD